jgi:hypothetical protein
VSAGALNRRLAALERRANQHWGDDPHRDRRVAALLATLTVAQLRELRAAYSDEERVARLPTRKPSGTTS